MKLNILLTASLVFFSFNQAAFAFNPKAVDNFNSGYKYYGERNFEKAAAEFKRVLILEPGNDKVNEILGNIYRQLNRYEEAKYYSLRAIAVNPANDNAYTNIGNILVEQNKLKDSLFYFKKAIEINPDNKLAVSQIESINKIHNSKMFLLIKE